MIRSLAKIAVAFAILVSATAPTLSEDLNPVGRWQSTGGESRYEVVRCGNGGQLCAKLTWLRSDARTAENLQYLNRYVVSGAVPADDNRWRGTVHYDGQDISGSMTMMSGDRLRVSGCRAIMCQTMTFNRI